MEQHNATTTAEQYKQMSEQTQAVVQYEAWSIVASRFLNEHTELHELLDNADAWSDMTLEVWTDEHGQAYFKIITGMHYQPGDTHKKRVSEAAHEFLQQYRNELCGLIRANN